MTLFEVLLTIAMIVADGSVVFKPSTSAQQLTAINEFNPPGYSDLSCAVSIFVDTNENISYNFVSETMQTGNGYQSVISNIYDNELNPFNPYNNSLNLPFETHSTGFSFDQCNNPITNDMIFCYSNLAGQNSYIYCKIFYNNHVNGSYWGNAFAVSNPVSMESSSVPYLSIICFDDSYLVIWMCTPLRPQPQSLRYSLIDLNANIHQHDIIIYQSNADTLLQGSIGAVKRGNADFIITYVYENRYLRYIMGQYSELSIHFNESAFNKQIKIYYDNQNVNDFNILSFAPSTVALTDNCCYLIPYRVENIYKYVESIYFTIIDKSGEQILNETMGTDGDILIQNGPKYDAFVANQMIELSMLNQQENTGKYFMSLYSLQNFKNGVAGTQYIKGTAYNIEFVEGKYNLQIVSKDVSFLENMKTDEAFADTVCAQVLPVYNNGTMVLVWSQLQQINKTAHKTFVFGQSWRVTN